MSRVPPLTAGEKVLLQERVNNAALLISLLDAEKHGLCQCSNIGIDRTKCQQILDNGSIFGIVPDIEEWRFVKEQIEQMEIERRVAALGRTHR